MRFLDRTILRLIDPTERASILTPTVGDRLLAAAFVFQNVEVGGVTGVSVRDVELLPSVVERRQLEGVFFHAATGNRWDGTAMIGTHIPKGAVDARIELFLTTETRIADTSVERVEVEALGEVADLAVVDARIIAEDGGLPNAALLGARRYAELKEMVHERFEEADEFDVDAFFERNGISNVEELLEYLLPPRYPQRVELELTVNGTLPSRIANHRIIAGVHIEENPVERLHAVIEEIQISRALLAANTETAQTPSGMLARAALPYLLVFAEPALDDDDLPLPAGVEAVTESDRRDARLRELQTRLQPFGVALAPVTT